MFVGTAGKFSFSVAFTVAALMPVVFIRIVQTVVVPIANVNTWDAVAIVASKQVAKTSFRTRFTIIWWLVSSY